ncbi:glycosyltransferase [Porphyromonas crevioricanis]|uniref:glycosyltransferase n=1 Tax=Porphyromonas crevioricanis TaxID=393921 RepID=UPI0009D3B222|nr:glycosyltransferase [Porphyromonas crevioricanis]SJZ68806.1 Glycosyl transferase family 2 [Porphyromonas crevioricanis]
MKLSTNSHNQLSVLISSRIPHDSKPLNEGADQGSDTNGTASTLSEAPYASDCFSVLMSVYYKENPNFLHDSLQSIFEQSLPAPEVVIVWDGPLTKELETILCDYKQHHPQEIKYIRLPQNKGLGNALNIGLRHCSHELIVRMDTDDIAHRNRFEQQVAYLQAHPEVDVISSAIDEFTDSPEDIVAVRRLPEQHQELVRFAKHRSPMNHPAVAFRKSSVQRAGGYVHFPYFEDYYLWARIIQQGGRLYCSPDSLLSFRMNRDTYGRRKGWRYALSEVHLQNTFLKMGFINKGQYVRNLCLRVPPRFMPRSLLSIIYKHCLRKKRKA